MHFEQTVMEMKQANTFFESTRPVFISRAPGRLDVMGGNDDIPADWYSNPPSGKLRLQQHSKETMTW
jgi:hypothetical protein